MEITKIGLIVIGIILLVITGAFVFSGNFRRDVIAAEGEASVLGLFNVKGVVIILLITIFSGSFIYIINQDAKPGEIMVEKDTVATKVLYNVATGEYTKEVKPSGRTVREVCARTSVIKDNISVSVKVGRPYAVQNIPHLFYRLDRVENCTGSAPRPRPDSVNKSESVSKYEFYVSMAELVGSDTVWCELPYPIGKTMNGRIDKGSSFQTVGADRWARQYNVLFAFGQPDPSLSSVEMASYLVVATKMELK